MRSGLANAVVLFLSGFAGSALPASVTLASDDPAFHKWFDDLWRTAVDQPADRGLRVRMRVVDEFVPTTSELADLRKAVEGHPEHPLRAKLGYYDLAIVGKPFTTTTQIWMRGGEWRQNQDTINTLTGDFFEDDCVRTDSMWSHQKGQLVRVSLAQSFPANFDFRKGTAGSRRWLWCFATGGISLVSLDGFSQPTAVLTGDVWEATTTGGSAAGGAAVKNLRLVGSWDPKTGRGRVDNVQWRGRTPRADDSDLRADGWQDSSEFGRPIAASVREIRADGRVVKTYTLLDCGPVDRAEMARITAEPKIIGGDAIRGKSEFTSIYDFTGSEGTIAAIEPGKQPSVVPYNEGQSKAHTDLQRAGWWAGATLVAAIFVIRLRQWVKIRGTASRS